MSSILWLVIAAGVLAVAYGAIQSAPLMRLPAGNARMQEIAAAIQEGAQAYLRRQYTTIAMVGVVILIAVFFLIGWTAALGFLIGATLSGAAGFAGMLISVRANVRTAQAASESLAKGLSLAFRSGAITGMLVAGFALLGVAGYFTVPDRGPAGWPNTSRDVVDSPGGARLRRLADLHLRPSRRRHLHQGRRRRRRHGGQGRGRHPRGRPAQRRHHRRQRGRQRRRLRRHGRRPVRDLRGDHGRHHGAGGDLLPRHGGRQQHDAAAAGHLRRSASSPRSSAPSSCAWARTTTSWAPSTRA